jgi:hypothetical protein
MTLTTSIMDAIISIGSGGINDYTDYPQQKVSDTDPGEFPRTGSGHGFSDRPTAQAAA